MSNDKIPLTIFQYVFSNFFLSCSPKNTKDCEITIEQKIKIIATTIVELI